MERFRGQEQEELCSHLKTGLEEYSQNIYAHVREEREEQLAELAGQGEQTLV